MFNDPAIQELLQDLHSSDARKRQNATARLWQIWFSQKGDTGLETLRRTQFLIEIGETEQAEMILNQLIETYPDFVEARNQRAIYYYSQNQIYKSLQDCQKVVKLNPNHFGAWHGLGLCYAALEEYHKAIEAFNKALEIQPYATINQKLILECTVRLN
ncbi:tetratricopeptide repeat protein [Spirulina sp. CS-785/01]|uniref:tetratricopeptide repeat protein n=1 Tax=Spirulina sp. CS-785/01 TaxID=3021716 RepID=UPI00232FD008|nr:tetratricopeptide repeat protein [Spirulina sp. CS-785/01]MDB9314342.1 tetratricopeptide repeat protein [Spirulina sp. CS-785/01]